MQLQNTCLYKFYNIIITIKFIITKLFRVIHITYQTNFLHQFLRFLNFIFIILTYYNTKCFYNKYVK